MFFFLMKGSEERGGARWDWAEEAGREAGGAGEGGGALLAGVQQAQTETSSGRGWIQAG